MGFKPDKYQTAIYEAFTTSNAHLFIDAKAGAGKTTTLVHLTESVSDEKTAISFAFNKKIQKELRERIPDNIACMTLNSYGYAALRDNGLCDHTGLDRWKVGKIIVEMFPKRSKYFRETLGTLVGLHKNTLEKKSKKLVDIYGVNLWDCNAAELFATVPRVLKKDKSLLVDKGIWDYDDQLWAPHILDLKLPIFDFVFIDETQDLNRAQLELVFKSIGNQGRVVAVGDPFQAIYAFRGADVDSIKRITSKLDNTERGCQKLPLSISYRCSKSVIEEAKNQVTGIEASPYAIEGSVDIRYEEQLSAFIEKLKPEHLQAKGGMRRCIILCRSNSPLVEWYSKIKKLGLPVCFQSSLVCSQLHQLVAVHSRYHKKTLDETCRSLYIYGQKASATITNVIAREAFLDKILSLIKIIENVPQETETDLDSQYQKIEADISEKFATGGDSLDINAILLSTIHSAKGLEASTVLILRPDLMPHPLAKTKLDIEQERNIKYVAITRSSGNLYYVRGNDQKPTSLVAFFEN